MSHRTEREAADAAHQLVMLMSSGGWTPKVWDNIGWHHCIEKGVAAVYPSSVPGEYIVFFNTARQVVVGRVTDPNEGVSQALKLAGEDVRKTRADIGEVLA